VPLAGGTTPYVRFGDWPVHTALLVLVVWGAYEGVRTVRLRRRQESASAQAANPSSTARTTRSHSS
jgi:apolipoprotein N-acyltransferase